MGEREDREEEKTVGDWRRQKRNDQTNTGSRMNEDEEGQRRKGRNGEERRGKTEQKGVETERRDRQSKGRGNDDKRKRGKRQKGRIKRKGLGCRMKNEKKGIGPQKSGAENTMGDTADMYDGAERIQVRDKNSSRSKLRRENL